MKATRGGRCCGGEDAESAKAPRQTPLLPRPAQPPSEARRPGAASTSSGKEFRLPTRLSGNRPLLGSQKARLMPRSRADSCPATSLAPVLQQG